MASALESSTGGVAGRQPSVAQQHIEIDLFSALDRGMFAAAAAASKRARESAHANSSLPAGNGFEGTLMYDPTHKAVLEAAQYAAEHWGFSTRACPEFDPLSRGGCPRGSGCRFYHLEACPHDREGAAALSGGSCAANISSATAAGCAKDDQCTKLHYRPTAAVLASTAGNSSVPCSSGCSTTCMCSTSGQQNQGLFNKLVWLAGQNYLGSLKFLRFPGDADPMSIGLNLGKTEEAPWTRARARVPTIASSVFPRFRRRKALGLNFFQPHTGGFF